MEVRTPLIDPVVMNGLAWALTDDERTAAKHKRRSIITDEEKGVIRVAIS